MSRLSQGVEADENAADAIVDLVITGTYATDDTPIKVAIDSILAVLRDAGMIKS